MSQKEELIEKLNILKERRIAEAAIRSGAIRIQWETDVRLIDLGKLRSFKGVSTPQTLRCEMINMKQMRTTIGICPLFGSDPCIGDKQILELLDLIENGVKIIPPVFERMSYYTDDVKQSEEGLCFSDGSHRLRIANALGLDEIPILVNYARCDTFTFDNNTIEVMDSGVRINGEREFTFSGHRFEVKEDGLTITQDVHMR